VISSISLNDLVKKPDIGYGQTEYLVDPQRQPELPSYAGIQLPIFSSDGWLLTNHTIHVSKKLIEANPQIKLHIEGSIPTQFMRLPVSLMLKINRNIAYQTNLNAEHFKLDIPFKDLNFRISRKLSNQPFLDLEFTTDKVFIPHQINKESGDARELSINVTNIKFIDATQNYTTLPVEETQKFCTQQHSVIVCKLTIVSNAGGMVQLPLLYYPKMLKIKVDGTDVAYSGVKQGLDFLLAGIILAPGSHEVRMGFQGIAWANWCGLIAWIALLLTVVLSAFKKPGS
jgi:hypothetical protein